MDFVSFDHNPVIVTLVLAPSVSLSLSRSLSVPPRWCALARVTCAKNLRKHSPKVRVGTNGEISDDFIQLGTATCRMILTNPFFIII
jgi:hypothetical protein